MAIENKTVLRGATSEIIEVNVDELGISVEHLVRPISEADVYELAEKDNSRWEPIEIRFWPAGWQKPSPSVVYHVISGNHRTSAARLKGLTTLHARLIEATDERSYLIAAITSNTQHGKQFTREEYVSNAKKLQAQGMNVTEIATVLGYSKSSISRMLSGNDSHAAAKREEGPPEVEELPSFLSAVEVPGVVKQKITGLVVGGRMEADMLESRAYVATLKRTQQESLHHLLLWLQEVLNG